MRSIGRVVGMVLNEMQAATRAGLTTGELDAICAAALARHGARPTPKHQMGFPGASCISVNDEIVHGIPGGRKLWVGDVVKLDVTADLDGFVADAARTVIVGRSIPRTAKLVQAARDAFHIAMPFARAGRLVREVGKAVEGEARRQGLRVVRELTGHGVGRKVHEWPEVYNYEETRCMTRFVEGMVITIEPVVTYGSGRTVTNPDGWTVRTADRALAAHFEETLVITRGEPIILTAA